MQNENPNPPALEKRFKGIIIAGTVLLAVGLLAFHDLWYGRSGWWLPSQLESMLVLSPVFIAVGGIMVLMGLFRFLAGLGWAEKIAPISARNRLGKVWRVFIWLAVVCTLYPYWWLDILTRMNGHRPGNEGEGMFGYFVMVFFGLPCLVVAILNEVRLYRNQSSKK